MNLNESLEILKKTGYLVENVRDLPADTMEAIEVYANYLKDYRKNFPKDFKYNEINFGELPEYWEKYPEYMKHLMPTPEWEAEHIDDNNAEFDYDNHYYKLMTMILGVLQNLDERNKALTYYHIIEAIGE